jgi:cytidine deaminase
MGSVGAALESEGGRIYTGVSIDTSSSMGFCAEPNPIGSMVTAGESVIKRIVAVWRDERGVARVLPPCGRCREFMFQVDGRNLDTEVIVGPGRSVKLREILPLAGSEWPEIDDPT